MPQYPSATQGLQNQQGQTRSGSAGSQGDQSVGQRHGKYYLGAFGQGGAKIPVPGSIFGGANQVGATTSVGLATTYTGLCLNNPITSKVNLALKRVKGIVGVAPAAVTLLGLIVGFSAAGIVTHTTSLDADIINQAVGAANAPASLAHLDAACTLVGTPLWERWFTITPGATSVGSFSEDIDDAILLAPGAYAAIGTNIAGPASGLWASFEWEELPLV